jgi:aspartate/methionine/tyrosine aminotransferase
MSLKLSHRSVMPIFRALGFLRMANQRIAQGEDIIRLEAGQPSKGAPQAAIERATAALLKDPKQGYTESLGIPALRKRIARWYKDEFQFDVDYQNIAVTFGASGAFLLSFLTVFDAGDTVALAAPAYPAYRNILKTLGINVLEIPTDASTYFQPTLAQLKALNPIPDGLIITSPSNPTGTIIAEDDLKAIAQWCEENGVRIISDELYQHVTFDRPVNTIGHHSKSAIIINSFSKYFAMTGWRLGWMIMPSDVIARAETLADSLFVSPPTMSQYVALEAFEHKDVLDGYVEAYRENLAILLTELPKIGFRKLTAPYGAFYIYINVSEYTNDSDAFCLKMMDEIGLSITPGTDFDPERGNVYIRISFAGAKNDIIRACDRLKNWDFLKEHHAKKA